MRTSVTAFLVLAGCVSGALGQDYQSLVHRPDGFVGFIVSCRGKVVRSVLDGSDYALQVNVTLLGSDTWSDPVWIDYRVRSERERILVGQIIDFRGKVAGTKPYALGTMPYVIACDVRPVIKNYVRTVLRPCDVPPRRHPCRLRGGVRRRRRGRRTSARAHRLGDPASSAPHPDRVIVKVACAWPPRRCCTLAYARRSVAVGCADCRPSVRL